MVAPTVLRSADPALHAMYAKTWSSILSLDVHNVKARIYLSKGAILFIMQSRILSEEYMDDIQARHSP